MSSNLTFLFVATLCLLRVNLLETSRFGLKYLFWSQRSQTETLQVSLITPGGLTWTAAGRSAALVCRNVHCWHSILEDGRSRFWEQPDQHARVLSHLNVAQQTKWTLLIESDVVSLSGGSLWTTVDDELTQLAGMSREPILTSQTLLTCPVKSLSWAAS